MDKKCQKWPKLPIFTIFGLRYPPGNGPLMALEAWNMYKMLFKSYNPSLDTIRSKKPKIY